MYVLLKQLIQQVLSGYHFLTHSNCKMGIVLIRGHRCVHACNHILSKISNQARMRSPAAQNSCQLIISNLVNYARTH